MPGNHVSGLTITRADRQPLQRLREPSPEDSICDAELYFVGTLRTLKDKSWWRRARISA